MSDHPPNQHGSIHDQDLIRAMRCNVTYTDVATMPIPLYERMKAAIAASSCAPTQIDNVKQDQQREISVVDAFERWALENGFQTTKRRPPYINNMIYAFDTTQDAYEAWRAALRTHKPVMSEPVSLKKCARAVYETPWVVNVGEYHKSIAKAVLDAAVVPYVD